MIPLPARAYVFIGLNVARFLSILTLLLVFSSTIQVMVGDIHAIKKGPGSTPNNGTVSIGGTEYYYDCDYLVNSTVPLQPGGSMFAIINHLFIIFQCIVLVLAEVSWPSWFFNNYLPVLGSEHGVTVLGFLQIFIGAAVLSHHVGTFALVSAFFLFAVGCINVLLGLAFRASIKTKRSLTSWRERGNTPTLPRTQADFRAAAANGAAGVFGAGGSLFTHVTGMSATSGTATTNNGNANMAPSAGGPPMSEKAGFGFGRQGEKSAALRGFLISRPQESLPRYVPKPGGGSASAGAGSRSPPRAASRASSAESSASDSDNESVDLSSGPARTRGGAAMKANRI